MMREAAIRLSFIGLLLGAWCAGTAPAQAQGADLEKELVIVATGGVFEKALRENFYEPFTKATGVVVRAVPASNAEQWAKVKAMDTAGRVEWDIVTAYPEDLFTHRALLGPIDCAALSNLAANAVEKACVEYGLLRTTGGGVLAYNKSKLPAGEGPRNWVDFWDVKRFPGPRALPNYGAPWWVLMAALQADGVAPNALYPLDLDRAFRKLDELKPNVKVWWRTGDQSQQIIRDGEVVMSMMWSGRAFSMKAGGAPVEAVWEGAPTNTALWSVLKKAPHPKAAKAFLDFFLGNPEAHAAFSRAMDYDTSNRKALEGLTPAERATRAIAPENASKLAGIDDEWVAHNRAALVERWNAWIAR